MASKSRKRRTDNSDHDSDSDNEMLFMNDNFPRFLVISAANESRPLSTLHPFAVDKGLKGIAGTLKSVKRLRDGSFLVECNRRVQANNLMKAEVLVGIPISTKPHSSLNSSKGVIKCPDLKSMSETEIRDELRSQGVMEVRRVTIRKEGLTVPTNTYFLTFNTPNIPQSLKIGYLKVSVKLFIPAPMRCFKCQKYGHSSRFCNSKSICRKCGKDDHEGQCSGPEHCINCSGAHAASSKDCPRWRLENEIQRVRTERKVSFAEAKKVVEQMQPGSASASTYAQVVSPKPTTKSVEIQTDLTWVKSKEAVLGAGEKKQACTQATPSSSRAQTASSPAEPKAVKNITAPVVVIDGVRINSNDIKEITKTGNSKHKRNGDRPPKMEANKIKLHNRFSSLEDAEMIEEPSSPPRAGRERANRSHSRSNASPPRRDTSTASSDNNK